jgi:hypothetical protein
MARGRIQIKESNMRTKQEILNEIKRTANENGGKALGIARFESETGIKPYDWERFWARFGDAIEEAGFSPNQLQSAYTDGFLLEKLVGLARKLGKFPTYREITLEGNHDPEFPNKKTFARLGSKEQLSKKVLEYCQGKVGYDDIAVLCSTVLNRFQQGLESGSGPGGRWFKSTRPDQPFQ